jgi:hypothetical protein
MPIWPEPLDAADAEVGAVVIGLAPSIFAAPPLTSAQNFQQILDMFGVLHLGRQSECFAHAAKSPLELRCRTNPPTDFRQPSGPAGR